MELENIVANTVYLKAREGKMLYIHDFMSDRDVTANVLPLILLWINKYFTNATNEIRLVLWLKLISSV